MATEAKPRAAMDVSTSLTSLPRDRSERNSVQSTRGNSSREKWRNIMGRGRQCPTCNGTGTIPKEQEDELVALIPYKDDRLKPRRTCLYVSIVATVLLTVLITGGLLGVFMSPRDVVVKIGNSKVNVSFISPPFPTKKNATAILQILTNVNITNYNYFPVTVGNVNVTILHLESRVGYNVTEVPSSFVSGRSTLEVETMVDIQFKNATAYHVIGQCYDLKKLSLEPNVVVTYTYFSLESSVVDAKVNVVNCSNRTTY